jgi:hypothetical protein
MASQSLPPQRPASQRRATPPAESSPVRQEQEQEHVPRTSSFSTQSVDSQTLLLGEAHVAGAAPAPQEDEEPRKCWICFNDETEDDESTSPWRSPCACSLVAHESCLLDWIADMEAPNSRRRAGHAGRIQCPQCKSNIRLERPRSLVVDAVRAAERWTGTLLLPGVGLVAATVAYSTFSVLGTSTIYQIFGTPDALHILRPLYETPDMRIASPILRLLLHLREHWRLDLGLPLIPAVLVASRTTFADSFLPFLPLIFFVSSGQPGDEMLQLQWPPSAAFSFAALPYLRGFYNAFYDRVCLPQEQRWLKEIQPRAGTEDAPADDEHAHNHDHDHDHGDAEEVDIDDFDIFGGWNNGPGAEDVAALENPPVPIIRGPAPPINAPPIDDEAEENDDNDMPALVEVEEEVEVNAAPAPNVPLQPAQPRPPQVRRERVIFSTTSLADTILGALIFPTIAAAMGELLRHTLPTSWVAMPTSWLGGWMSTGGRAGLRSRQPTGFLQTRWGRSIVGGCVFVGLKDMVLLYVRWKMAQSHRRRRIVDFDRKKSRRGGGAAAGS